MPIPGTHKVQNVHAPYAGARHLHETLIVQKKYMKNRQLNFNTQKVKEAISDDRPYNAIREIKRFLSKIDDDILESQLILIESNFKRIKKEKATLTPDEYSVRYNRLNSSILELSSDIRDFLQREYSKDIINQNSQNLELINKQIEEMKLETLKSQENIKKAIQLNFYVKQEQINKLGDCWAEIYTIEKQFFDILNDIELTANSKRKRQINKAIKNQKISNSLKLLTEKEHDYYKELFMKLLKEYNKSDFILEKSRYWLGDNLYKAGRAYHNCFPSFVNYFKSKDFIQCDTCYSDMVHAKAEVSTFVQAIQKDLGI